MFLRFGTERDDDDRIGRQHFLRLDPGEVLEEDAFGGRFSRDVMGYEQEG
jgi:hypothetical protein